MDMPIRFDEDVEEGQIGPLDDYDPAFEYPGNEVSQYHLEPHISSPSPPPASASSSNRTTVFRLLRLRSSVLSRSKRIAVLDGHAEVSIGRDVSPSARVRLKEMAVSKFHASIYWDGVRREWSIVDMGSVHGTFVRHAQDPSSSNGSDSGRAPGTRLSEARKASMPRVLRHLDEITIGGTTLLIHEHLTRRPCTDCATDGTEEISLFSETKQPPRRDEQSLKRKLENDPGEIRDPKKAMANLKSSLLSRHKSSSAPPTASNPLYKDRSALRRELHPEPRVHTLPAAPARLDGEESTIPPVFRFPSPPPPPAPPGPLPSSNIGHKLLLQQGWNPGTALGENPDGGLVEPLDLHPNASRAGLGSSVPRSASQPLSSGEWREDAKRRRWDGVRGS